MVTFNTHPFYRELADRELLRLLPAVLRARDFHLYLEGGKRLIDLWLQGGMAILGHKPSMVLKEMKNAAERGLFTTLPHPAEGRFLKALAKIFPDCTFRLYLDSHSLCNALEKTGYSNEISLWRPFMEEASGRSLAILPVLPWSLGPSVLVLDKTLEDTFPSGDLIPPVLLAPATRALYNLIAMIDTPGRRYQKVEKALKNSQWRGKGIYINLKSDISNEEYKVLFKNFLEGGFLIPPTSKDPLILPGTMSKGEEAKLAGLLSP